MYAITLIYRYWHPGRVQHTLLVFCFVDVHTTTPPAPADEYINAICHVLH